MDAAGEDVLVEVLRRLDVESLVRAAISCKSWYTVVFSSTFIAEYRASHPDGVVYASCCYKPVPGTSKFMATHQGRAMGEALPIVAASDNYLTDQYHFSPSKHVLYRSFLRNTRDAQLDFLAGFNSGTSTTCMGHLEVYGMVKRKWQLLRSYGNFPTNNWKLAPTTQAFFYTASGGKSEVAVLQDDGTLVRRTVYHSLDVQLNQAVVNADMVMYCYGYGSGVVSFDLKLENPSAVIHQVQIPDGYTMLCSRPIILNEQGHPELICWKQCYDGPETIAFDLQGTTKRSLSKDDFDELVFNNYRGFNVDIISLLEARVLG